MNDITYEGFYTYAHDATGPHCVPRYRPAFTSARGGAYVVPGGCDPEATIRVFNNAIEQAYIDGFAGFRAAAEMSWPLEHDEGTHQLIVYEALLRSLFANCEAIGLCLYDRRRMPLGVINGALDTHPFTVHSSGGDRRTNPFYDAATNRLSPAHVNIRDSSVPCRTRDRRHADNP